MGKLAHLLTLTIAVAALLIAIKAYQDNSTGADVTTVNIEQTGSETAPLGSPFGQVTTQPPLVQPAPPDVFSPPTRSNVAPATTPTVPLPTFSTPSLSPRREGTPAAEPDDAITPVQPDHSFSADPTNSPTAPSSAEPADLSRSSAFQPPAQKSFEPPAFTTPDVPSTDEPLASQDASPFPEARQVTTPPESADLPTAPTATSDFATAPNTSPASETPTAGEFDATTTPVENQVTELPSFPPAVDTPPPAGSAVPTTAANSNVPAVAPNTANSPPPAPAAKPKTVVVGPNDSFWTLSEKEYGTGDYFKALYEYNRERRDNADAIRVGDEILVPPVSDLQRLYPGIAPNVQNKPVSTAVQQGTPAVSSASSQVTDSGSDVFQAVDGIGPQQRALDRAAQQVEQAASATGGGERIYVVQPGDTVLDIARTQLGDVARWADVYRLNRTILGDDIGQLTPGTRLILPASP